MRERVRESRESGEIGLAKFIFKELFLRKVTGLLVNLLAVGEINSKDRYFGSCDGWFDSVGSLAF